ncbi:PHP domain-containing protein [Christensenellaceae bacterium NSJ-63]|uniref:PHP domain-containing protein n=1 Tax=Guopingia tenuis TaxID=2763656 RepID=A0A926HX14_9FIRM|nr:PHP domain-containing protein [Guopingia tenuis]MBC8538595.1 PHP domain-containing protein [Guopingia tenuis]MBS5644165.1 PHP domain-containing protein [Clostridiales bacterium]
MMVQVETHCHTAETSSCGRVPAAKIVADYKKAGYRMLITTDHYYERMWERPELAGRDWQEKMDAYMRGYRAARAAGEALGVRVLFATEIQFDGCAPHDFLIYGMSEEYMRAHPYLNRMRPEEFYAICRREGFYMIHAHPFRKGKEQPYLPVCYDAVEVFNGHPRHDSHNQRAVHFALENGLAMFSGTDYHWEEDCGRGGILLPEETDTMEKVVAYLRSRQAELIVTYEEGKEEEK